MRILLIEDDESIADFLKQALIAQHYLVEVAADGQAGWNLVTAFEYDLILLDLRLPKLDGISFCQRLRHVEGSGSSALNCHTPILLMTAEDATTNRVAGLDAGADDYIVKPFDLAELLARVRALLRRGNIERSPLLKWGQLQIDPSGCQVSYQGKPFHLSSKEYRLLELFLRYPQRIFSHGTLIEHLWALEDMPTENAVRAQIKGLRKKLKEVGAEDCIETVYGLGYRLKEIGKTAEDKKIGEDPEKRSGDHKGLLSPDVTGVAPMPEVIPQTRNTSQNSPQISAFWQQYRGEYIDRLSVIEQAVAAWRNQTLTEELQQQAQREAHTLKGSLGLFGLDHAAALSHQIECLLQEDLLAQKQQVSLVELISCLRQALQHPFPEMQSAAATLDAATPSQQAVSVQQAVLPQRSRLLIVDDDVQVLNFLQGMLQPWGFQVALLSDPQQFWHTLEKVNPDLLMLDIEMPECNGIDLCQRIRSDLCWGDLPILMLSASNDDSTIQQVFMAGADDYVSKPFRAAELVARVIRRLEHATVLKKLRGLEG